MVCAHGISPALPRQDIPRRERFAWRARIRAHAPALAIYRIVVAVIGVLFLVAAGLTGPLPGPGGIPLFLAGMSILASEFRWAHGLTVRAMILMRAFERQSWSRRGLLIAAFMTVLMLLGYLALVIVGLPSWFPTGLQNLLGILPGI